MCLQQSLNQTNDNFHQRQRPLPLDHSFIHQQYVLYILKINHFLLYSKPKQLQLSLATPEPHKRYLNLKPEPVDPSFKLLNLMVIINFNQLFTSF